MGLAEFLPDTAEARVCGLALWRGPITVTALSGGLSNASFVVSDGGETFVARVGDDCPAHHVSRARELLVSRAAHAAGLSPEVVFGGGGVMVLRHLEARTFGEADVRANAARCVALLKRAHLSLPERLTGPGAMFWVFHVLRDYAHTLEVHGHRHAARCAGWLATARRLEAAQVALPIVFGHHDLLPANFLDDGERLWLIDWEYGAFGTAMFDLASLAALSSFGREEERALLESYFDRPPGADLWRAFDAMKAAAALREALWGMVSELVLAAPGVDYAAYAETHLARFEASLAGYEERHGRG